MTFLNHILSLEIFVNVWAQQSFRNWEVFLAVLSVHVSPRKILDIWLPLVGSFDTNLLIDLTTSFGVINCVGTIIKWMYPEHRPFTWSREFDGPEIVQTPLTCETTSGFPSGHSMGLTGFVYIVAVKALPKVKRFFQNDLVAEAAVYSVVLILSMLIWISRLYFGCHFLHQVLIGSTLAVFIANFMESRKGLVLNLSRRNGVLAVIGLAVFCVVVYFVVLYSGWDPHWSVRAAFQWCEDPTYLKHESSPIFSLGTVLGYLMGIALSCPLAEISQHKLNQKWSIPCVLALEAANNYFRFLTPKQNGRVVFVGYEFIRNALHTYTLLRVVPKICDR